MSGSHTISLQSALARGKAPVLGESSCGQGVKERPAPLKGEQGLRRAGSTNGGDSNEPPNSRDTRTVNLIPEGERDNALLISTITFIASAGFGFLSHFRENAFGSLTKALKVLCTLVALCSGTVALASVLKPDKSSGFQTTEEFSHSMP